MRKIAKKVSSVICDDIRMEVGNKHSYMGVYNDMHFKKIPALIKNLSMGIMFHKLNIDVSKISSTITLPGKEPVKLGIEEYGKNVVLKGTKF